MTRFAMTGLLLLIPALGLAACGASDGGADVPAGFQRVEIGGLRFVLPTGLPIDRSPGDGSLFIARPPGVLAEQARVVANVQKGDATLLQVVGEVRDTNVTGVKDLTPRSDVELKVPGSDGAHRLVSTFVSGQKLDVPTTRTTVIAQKGKSFYLFSVVVPDAKRGKLDVDTIVNSLELT